MIKENVDESLFISRFEDFKRVKKEGQNGNFTYKGLRALFEYLEEISTEENPINLDVISLCCDFAEYEDIDEYLNDYQNKELKERWNKINKALENAEKGEINDLWIARDEFIEELENEIMTETTLIKLDDDLDEGFIIQSY